MLQKFLKNDKIGGFKMGKSEILNSLKSAIIDGNIPEILQHTMHLALFLGASDIHIEPQKNIVKIRLRVDGILQVVIEYPISLHSGIISKIKIMSNLKIDESRIPQDGRITTFINNVEVDMRTSTLPTNNGEKIVMRVVDKSKKIPSLENLGIRGRNYEKFLRAIKMPNGIILTTGPTGSGKTTTMYSAMSVLNSPEKNIMTFEDPIENQMAGLNQSQMRPNIGYTFASGLRTALRQDPDIIMVGEIRDKETIDIAIEASLTGHLVLSTIHTNSAVDTIVRILNMGVPDFLLTASTNLIIAQRLCRRLCEKCKTPMPPSIDAEKKLQRAFQTFQPYDGFDMGLLNDPMFFSPNSDGCDECNLGYRGRVGIYEILEISESIKKLILEKAPFSEITKTAQKEGMITLEQDGLIRVAEGKTSFEEIYKIVKK